MLFTVRSADGTNMVYELHGSGPSLVLVHGGLVDRLFWTPSRPLLAQRFAVYAMDRRGHGDSDPYRADHHIEREYEDLSAVIHAVGGPVAVLGHSSGALVALETARHEPLVSKLVLYEPPQFDSITAEVRARLHASLAAGDLDGLLASFLIDVVEGTLPADRSPLARQEMHAGMRNSHVWSAALRNAPSIPVEADSYARYHFDAAEFCGFMTPTVLMLGTASSPVMQGWVEGFKARSEERRVG